MNHGENGAFISMENFHRKVLSNEHRDLLRHSKWALLVQTSFLAFNEIKGHFVIVMHRTGKQINLLNRIVSHHSNVDCAKIT